jgi:hypothetical protein
MTGRADRARRREFMIRDNFSSIYEKCSKRKNLLDHALGGPGQVKELVTEA